MPNEIFAVFDTTEGKFKIKLFPDKAPNTVANFVGLADGSKTGKPFYNGTTFHRVIPDFMIQGGCPQGTGTGGPGYKFADEFHPTLRHTKPGFLSMANAGPNTNGSQFFLISGQSGVQLPPQYNHFGQIVKGLDVLEQMQSVDTDRSDRPREDVVINSVTITVAD